MWCILWWDVIVTHLELTNIAVIKIIYESMIITIATFSVYPTSSTLRRLQRTRFSSSVRKMTTWDMSKDAGEEWLYSHSSTPWTKHQQRFFARCSFIDRCLGYFFFHIFTQHREVANCSHLGLRDRTADLMLIGIAWCGKVPLAKAWSRKPW